MVVDSLPVNAGDEQSVGRESDGAQDGHLLGVLGDRHAVDPPLDEEELQEVDEEGVHHAHSENDRVGILQRCLEDGRVLHLGRRPLNSRRSTQMAKAPRVRMVAVQIMPGTLMAPMLSLMYNKKSLIYHRIELCLDINKLDGSAAAVPAVQGEFRSCQDCLRDARIQALNGRRRRKDSPWRMHGDSSRRHYCKTCKLGFQ